MTASTGTLTWAALGIALLLVPVPSTASRRARTLAARGRLAQRADAAHARHRASWTAPRPFWLAWSGCLATAVVVTCVDGPALGVACLAAVTTGTALLRSLLSRRRATSAHAELRVAVQLLAAELTSGSRPAEALRAAATAGTNHAVAFAAAAHAAESTGEVEALLCATPDLAPLGHSWRVAAVSGAPLAEAVRRVAGDLAAREEQRRAVATALAGPRSSAALLACLPVLGIGLGIAMDAQPLAFLLNSPAGRGVCCVGVLLDVAGVWWTARLMQRAERA